MERLQSQRPSGIGRNTLRTWGILFLVCDVVSGAILQNRLLGLGTVSGERLLEAMSTSDGMALATAALVLQILGTCALPIFAFLLTEGAKHTSDHGRYLLRVLGVAAVSEIPYNLAYSGKLLDLSSRNPAFGLVLALGMLYFYRRYQGKSAASFFIKVLAVLAAVLWCVMLKVSLGAVVVLMTAVMWLLWDKPTIRNLAAAMVPMVCSVFSLFLMAAPMAFLAIHAYNGIQGEEKRLRNYLVYPLLLIAAVILGTAIPALV